MMSGNIASIYINDVQLTLQPTAHVSYRTLRRDGTRVQPHCVAIAISPIILEFSAFWWLFFIYGGVYQGKVSVQHGNVSGS